MPSFKAFENIQEGSLCTVCVEAQCPNQMECFHNGTATFMLLGPACTRSCTFCAVDKKTVLAPDRKEPARIAAVISEMDITYCVLTMVTRDDLRDGGALHLYECVREIRKAKPDILIELLISDLGGNQRSLERILAARPDVLNHNIETIQRLYPEVRPQAQYTRSLSLIQKVSQNDPPVLTKSGMMLGLGETSEEVVETMYDLFEAGCKILTLGQYLSPSKKHYPVQRYAPPEEFDHYIEQAQKIGFAGVASAPLVRSSYQAEKLFIEATT